MGLQHLSGRTWEKADPARYLQLNLEAHQILSGVPLHDVRRVELPGVGAGRTVADVRALLSLQSIGEHHPFIDALFRLRAWLGHILGWDTPDKTERVQSVQTLVPEAVMRRSSAPAGTVDGSFTVLYQLEYEVVGEARNAMVHAFSVLVLEPIKEGYEAFWAIYVAPVSRLTPICVAMIDPFRRFVVYPSHPASSAARLDRTLGFLIATAASRQPFGTD